MRFKCFNPGKKLHRYSESNTSKDHRKKRVFKFFRKEIFCVEFCALQHNQVFTTAIFFDFLVLRFMSQKAIWYWKKLVVFTVIPCILHVGTVLSRFWKPQTPAIKFQYALNVWNLLQTSYFKIFTNYCPAEL